ncbi:MAG: anthranilate synthase component II [Planctomycetota bacterium]
MILLIDNYDSFAHNLGRYLRRLGQEVHVARNDRVAPADVESMLPAAIVISPGPCTPREAGCAMELVRTFHWRIPILGVCLGHQVIAEALGGRIVRAREPMHGRASMIDHDGRGIFLGIESPIRAGRYHSLAVDEAGLPPELEVTARSADSTPMAIRHRELPLIGLQFHPESILTEHGYQLLANFLRLAQISVPAGMPRYSDEFDAPGAIEDHLRP